MNKILVLVEGQTEETIVGDVLNPHLAPAGVFLRPVILKTKREKWGTSFKGGVTSVRQVLGDLRALLGDSSAVAVTTLIDYYGLPVDFPGLANRPSGTGHQRVAHVEMAFAAAIDDRRFVPHLTLHEIEAWIFVDPTKCALELNGAATAKKLKEIRDNCGGPEAINDNPSTAPSKRILAIVPEYQKPFHGPLALTKIGMPSVRASCPHASSWLSQLERLG